jgi:hypothetical protein
LDGDVLAQVQAAAQSDPRLTWVTRSAVSGGGGPPRGRRLLKGEGGTVAAGGRRELDVNCFQDSCAGKDPKEAGCDGDAWTAALTKVQQVYVELRYSDACRAAWVRVSWERLGDVARVVGPHHSGYQDMVRYDTGTYSAVLAAPTPSVVRACAVPHLRTARLHRPGRVPTAHRAPKAPGPHGVRAPSATAATSYLTSSDRIPGSGREPPFTGRPLFTFNRA